MALRGNLLVLVLLFAAAATASGKSARLDLVPATPGAPLASRVRDDRRRHSYISTRLRSRRGGSGSRRVATEVAAPSAVSLPMSSGAYSGTGQYFVKLRVGTPAQEFTLVADTGSDLTWVKCAGSSPPGHVFRPKTSKSWAPIRVRRTRASWTCPSPSPTAPRRPALAPTIIGHYHHHYAPAAPLMSTPPASLCRSR
ncbi:unnamed protein product [Miscanthus lutarioriparius]|uniref:Peptidase A1 domain-containing protein n=1 Tax=Miscanthus lutarioriparius TaxID=422564 RepID=A0A811RUQ6_9POAL|nr:unnamed protein product [Miscanthus lutarioriparius]